MNWLGILKQWGPIALSLIPGVPPAIVPVIISGIESAEALVGAKGAEKKSHVMELATAAVTGFNALTKGPKLDPTETSTAVSSAVDTVVHVVNVVSGLKPVPAPAPAPAPAA